MYEISYNVVEYLVRTCTVCHSCINVLRNRGSRSILLCIMHMKSSNCTGTIVPLHPSSLYPNDRLRLPCNDIHSRVQVDSHVFTVSTMNTDVQAVHFAAGLNGDCPLHAANQTFRPILSSLTKQKNRTSDPTIYIMSNLSILSVLVALLIATNATATCLHTFQNCGAGCYNKTTSAVAFAHLLAVATPVPATIMLATNSPLVEATQITMKLSSVPLQRRIH